MDSFEASNIVFSRIWKFEPENVTKKIIGYLLLQDRGHEMIRLAFGPDTLIHNLIYKTKIQLGLVSKPVVSPPISPLMNLANPGISAFSSDYYYPEATCARSPWSPTLSEFPTKACHYFNKGFCKHGSNCRYFHGQPFPESLTQMCSPSTNDVVNEDLIFSPRSLEKLEFEII
ncbi:hypothetical protein HYC85_010840 [Camellia sinensis]|uniref:C3H1-type domain-containing protein n=1 Tax=Camellia sinensis TaxID=4442 RepID=A0A7J7HLS7_CAMSI|nr:hypothetical protein HYC85_010840 [Camellia sinensis]